MKEDAMREEIDDMAEEYDFSHARRGPIVPPDPNTTRIMIRLDTDVLDWFRRIVDEQGGGSYVALMNQALREYMLRQQSVLETKRLRLIREEPDETQTYQART